MSSVASKYLAIAEGKFPGEAAIRALKQCETLEAQIGADPTNILYSDRADEVLSYRQKVMEIEKDKDDFLYSLAGHKGETIESLRVKTVSDLHSFAERFNEELNGRH
jgi:hypothetical protein